MKLLAVCISSSAEKWFLEDTLFYCYTGDWEPFERLIVENGIRTLNISRERVRYLAMRRNKAVEIGLHENQGITDVMMVDSYYLNQASQLRLLISDYQECRVPVILGATTWALHKTSLIPKVAFYDTWTSIEARFVPLNYQPAKDPLVGQFITPIPNVMPVRSVGACYIFPRSVWDRGTRYGVLDDLHGCEHNYFCESANIPTYLDFNVRLWRGPFSYPLPKRVRVSLGLGTKLRKLRARILTSSPLRESSVLS